MIFKTNTELRSELISLPETGMGYQLVEAVKLRRNKKQKFIIFNAELIIEVDFLYEVNRSRIFKDGYLNVLNNSFNLDLTNLVVLDRNDLKNQILTSRGKMNEKGRYSGGRGAIDNQQNNANGEDVFIRLSAFENNRRIDSENKCLLPGSYTTTLEDYHLCKKLSDDPVDRYALPNEKQIEWAFYIQPLKQDKYRNGIVQPANSHSGGGIEALFDDGTSKDTYFKKTAY